MSVGADWWRIGGIGEDLWDGRIAGGSGRFFLDWRGALAVGVGGAAPELVALFGALAGGAERHQLAAFRAFGWLGIGPIGLIGRIGPIGPILFTTMGDSGGGELFGDAAAFDEVALQADELLVEQVVGLVDQADQRVGDDRRFFMGEVGLVERPTGAVSGVFGIGQRGVGRGLLDL